MNITSFRKVTQSSTYSWKSKCTHCAIYSAFMKTCIDKIPVTKIVFPYTNMSLPIHIGLIWIFLYPWNNKIKHTLVQVLCNKKAAKIKFPEKTVAALTTGAKLPGWLHRENDVLCPQGYSKRSKRILIST